MKAYTDLGQSKKLAEILPLESADMIYTMVNDYRTPFIRIETMEEMYEDDVLCWSLAALFGVMPEIQGGKPVIALDDNYITYPHMSDLYTKADNLVDACVAMIEKLHELKML